VGKDERECEAAARRLSEFYCYFGAWFRNERPIANGDIAPLSAQERAKMEMFSPAAMRANMAIGTSQEVIERLKRYEALGYDEYAYWADNALGGERNRDALKRFINEVMPAFA
jgi:alkanesulfonate monooxygenase SsuD/methylene tetrahydromethanopterin reductase-like flavin-dependent oxidoreductase (luciferase family)